MFPRKIKNFNVFVEGTGYLGKVVEASLPTLATKNSEYRGGGMEGSVDVDMGLEKMETSLTFSEWVPEIWGRFGRVQTISLLAADQGEDSFDARNHTFTMRGRFNKIEPDAVKPSEDANIKIMANLIYFKAEVGNATMAEIDIENMIRIIAGEDQMASMRAALAR